MRQSKTIYLLLTVSALLLAILLSSCSGENPVNPAVDSEFSANMDEAVKKGSEPIYEHSFINREFINGLLGDFETPEWEDVVITLDLRGGKFDGAASFWEPGKSISLVVRTTNSDYLDGPNPIPHKVVFSVPNYTGTQNGPWTTGECSIYKVINLPTEEDVMVNICLPLLNGTIPEGKAYWIGSDGTHTLPKSLIKPEGDDSELELAIFDHYGDGVSRDDRTGGLVIDPRKLGD